LDGAVRLRQLVVEELDLGSRLRAEVLGGPLVNEERRGARGPPPPAPGGPRAARMPHAHAGDDGVRDLPPSAPDGVSEVGEHLEALEAERIRGRAACASGPPRQDQLTALERSVTPRLVHAHTKPGI